MSKVVYKKVVATVSAAILAFSLSACGGGSQETGSSNNSSSPAPAPASSPASSGGGGSEAPLIVKFSHVGTPDSPKGQGADKFKEVLEAKSGGKIKVEVFPSSQLYGDNEEQEQLLAGNVQIINPSMTKLVKFNPSFQIVDMPFLFKSEEAFYKFWDSEMGEKMFAKIEPNGFKSLGVWGGGAKSFTNNKRPLITPEDFKGLKFRIQAGKVLEAQFKYLNASGVTIPFSEVYTALQQGTVDGQENMMNNIDTQKYVEVQKYLTLSEHGRLDYAVLTSKMWWDTLTADQQTMIQEAMDEATAFERSIAKGLSDGSFKKFKDEGRYEIYEMTEADKDKFREALKPMYDEFTPLIGQEFIDYARTLE
ncbi:DctP family TRAP transporter solute-binding subunit [Ammoniphilus sp. CFH 90114]|uniref:DctP family TRAP transporter solute-binding subunit n=1 Tax=Ammoniphilus sp. CFH 90114 TaxID=2493665 RepID=UPI00100DB39C|nr:DctP family TRAP transporter solute-binding subunit [Ammoniphilus sp. CFH 90114]RXT07212.1 DctP family TRAP transporter solute-binding subunit [Ammoniphilus sp. CFH 90114]